MRSRDQGAGIVHLLRPMDPGLHLLFLSLGEASVRLCISVLFARPPPITALQQQLSAADTLPFSAEGKEGFSRKAEYAYSEQEDISEG